MQAAVEACTPGGKVVLVGMGQNEMRLPLASTAVQEIDIIGSWRYANTVCHKQACGGLAVFNCMHMVAIKWPTKARFPSLISHFCCAQCFNCGHMCSILFFILFFSYTGLSTMHRSLQSLSMPGSMLSKLSKCQQLGNTFRLVWNCALFSAPCMALICK